MEGGGGGGGGGEVGGMADFVWAALRWVDGSRRTGIPGRRRRSCQWQAEFNQSSGPG